MVNFLLSKVELWIRGWDLMKALDFLNEWVFLKFSSTIVGSFLGFMLASLALGEIQLAKFIGFLFITMMLYLMLLASFFWYRPFVKDANKLELVGALFFGVVVVLFFAIFLK